MTLYRQKANPQNFAIHQFGDTEHTLIRYISLNQKPIEQ